MKPYQRLGVNIDHVATLRNARGEAYPSPVEAALLAERAGADGITAHLREDRRHIRDADMFALKEASSLPLNMEMAATEEMLNIALKVQPNACCIVPENRKEITTEGGLDVAGGKAHLWSIIDPLKEAGIRVSLFIDPDEVQMEAAASLEADIVELHTGTYCQHYQDVARREAELVKIVTAVNVAEAVGLECHAGHGLTYASVKEIAAFSSIVELNIGHFIIAQSVFEGMEAVVQRFRTLMDEARP